MVEPANTPSLTKLICSPPTGAKAKLPMKRDTVKPMPHIFCHAKQADSVMISVAALCGIGFTVIGNLAFAPVGGEQINLVKLGVLAGSTIAGLAGYFLLRFAAFPSR